MTLLDLSSRERVVLEDIAVSTDSADQLRRAQALLWLDEGEGIPEIAERLLVSRQTIYNWAARFQSRSQLKIGERLTDGPRSGRPRTAQGVIDELILGVIEQDPRAWGYRSTIWTAPLLRQYLEEVHELEVSRQSVSLALARLGIRWKRPRHHLALRPATWRPAKGG